MQKETNLYPFGDVHIGHPTRQPATLHGCLAALGCVSEARANQRVWWRTADGTEHNMAHADAWQWVMGRMVPA